MVNQTILQQNLDQYIEAMAPGKPHADEQGPMFQVLLYRTIQNVLAREGKDFTEGMDYLLQRIQENRDGVFNEKYVFRYMENIKLGQIERKTFERLLNLFITTADPATRTVTVKHVDIPTTVKNIPDGRVQQRLYEYYGVQ